MEKPLRAAWQALEALIHSWTKCFEIDIMSSEGISGLQTAPQAQEEAAGPRTYSSAY